MVDSPDKYTILDEGTLEFLSKRPVCLTERHIRLASTEGEFVGMANNDLDLALASLVIRIRLAKN